MDSSFIPRAVDLAAAPLGLERREEAFHRGVVPAISGSTHAARVGLEDV